MSLFTFNNYNPLLEHQQTIKQIEQIASVSENRTQKGLKKSWFLSGNRLAKNNNENVETRTGCFLRTFFY